MKQTILKTTIASIVLGLSISSHAEAGAIASSKVTIDNFLIKQNGNVLTYSDFQSLNFTSSSDVSAELNGLKQSSSSNSSNGAKIDLYASQGTPAISDNAFTELTANSGVPGPVGSNYVVSDTYEYGSPIDGLPSGTPLFTDDTGTDKTFLGVSSYVSLTGTGDGSAQSNNGLQALFSFKPAKSGVLNFEFEANPFVESYLESGKDGFAEASFSIVFSLIDSLTGDIMLDVKDQNGFYTDYIFGRTRSSGAPGSGISNKLFRDSDGGPTAGNLALSFNTLSLSAERDYQLSARMTATADAKFVPEPEGLALLGIGLLAMWNFTRKQIA